MTEKQLRHLFDVWQYRLGLSLWEIEVKVQECEAGTALFEIHRSTSYNRAVVRIPPWMMVGSPPTPPADILDQTMTDERIEQGVVHELLHCVRHYTHSAVMDRLDGLLHRDVYTVITEEFRASEELEIENLAVALVRAWTP